MLPRGRVYRYPPGRGLPDVPMTGVAGGMLSVPYDMGGMPMRDAPLSQPIPIGALATALANATPDQQRTVCTIPMFLLVHFYLAAPMGNRLGWVGPSADAFKFRHLLCSIWGRYKNKRRHWSFWIF